MNATGEQLSDRELEILRLVATGASNKEIAQELVISTNTVKVHLRNIFAKIGVNSRTEAAMYAVSEGIVSTPSAEAGEDVTETNMGARPAGINWKIVAVLLMPGLILLGVLIVAVILNLQSPSEEAAAVNPGIRWEELAPLPSNLAGRGVAILENNIYSIAGKTEVSISNRLYLYDPQKDIWVNKTPKPTAVMDIGAAVIGNLIYVPGGKTNRL